MPVLGALPTATPTTRSRFVPVQVCDHDAVFVPVADAPAEDGPTASNATGPAAGVTSIPVLVTITMLSLTRARLCLRGITITRDRGVAVATVCTVGASALLATLAVPEVAVVSVFIAGASALLAIPALPGATRAEPDASARKCRVETETTGTG